MKDSQTAYLVTLDAGVIRLRPIREAFASVRITFDSSKHHNQSNIRLPDTLPKMDHCVSQGPLGTNVKPLGITHAGLVRGKIIGIRSNLLVLILKVNK